MVRVINTQTGEEKTYNGELLVALSGAIFIKVKGKTVFATTSPNYVAEVVDK